jgi:hypothetical protein
MSNNSWSTISDLFSLNGTLVFILFPSKTRFILYYIVFTSHFSQNSNENSLESPQDVVDVPFFTPSPSLRPLQPTSLSPSHSHPDTKVSPSLFLPSMSSPILLPSPRSSPILLPLLPSHGSIFNPAVPDTPSLLDSSFSFAHMMNKTLGGESPASFLTCSSGWDPGVICEAVALPSLLDTPPSLETLRKIAAVQLAAYGHHGSAGTGIGLGLGSFTSLLQSEESISSNSRIAIATTVYLSPSLIDISTNMDVDRCIDIPNYDDVPSQPDALPIVHNTRTLTHLLVVEHSPTQTTKSISPHTSSPTSDISSVTSNSYEDPFHWDLVLSGLPCAPDLPLPDTIFVPSSKSSPLLPPGSVLSLLPCTQEEEFSSSASEPELTTASSSASDDIPTIVVMNPELMSIPVQSSISSIVGLYEGPVAPGQHPTRVSQISTLPLIEEAEEDEWWSDGNSEGSASYDEGEFEIVAVSALRTRLETIFEEDEMEDGGEREDTKLPVSSFISASALVFLSQTFSKTAASSDEANNSTSAVASSSWTISSENAAASKNGPSIDTRSDSFYSQASRRRHFPTSYSTNSTVRLVYSESMGSSLDESISSSTSRQPSAQSSTEGAIEDEESPWLFYFEDGAILEIPAVVQSSSSSTTKSKIAEKLASFPDVPNSPILSPFPSPLPSSVLSMKRHVSSTAGSASGSSHGITTNVSGLGLSILEDPAAGMVSSFLSPTWVSGRPIALASSSIFGLGLSGLAAGPPSESFSIDILGRDVDLGFGAGCDFRAPADKYAYDPASSGVSNRRERHVHFESTDFRPRVAKIERQYPKHRSMKFIKAKKSCFRRKFHNRSREYSDASAVPCCGVNDKPELSSSFSSSPIVQRGDRGRRMMDMFSARGRFWNGLKGCWASVDEGKHDDDNEYWEGSQGTSDGGTCVGMVHHWRKNENGPRGTDRSAFYERWRNAWI